MPSQPLRHGRRDFLITSATAAAGMALLGPCATPGQTRRSRPWMYLTADHMEGLRAVGDVRVAIREGHGRALWQHILDAARADLGAAPLTPASMVPGRSPVDIENYNPDWVICNAAGQRVMRSALVHLLTEEAGHKEGALHQMEALFDADRWPQWLDKAHLRFGHPAGLRTGMLSHDVALAYDWLHPSLTDQERRFVVDGLDRQGIQPYLQSLAQDPWWIHDLNNWMTTIVGGLAIAGMALGDDHPQSQALIDEAQPLMQRYMQIYGPEGEFNESVAYANATQRPVSYYSAYRYWSGGAENLIAGPPFPQTARWVMYFTLPPGRVAAFGDARPDMAPWIKHFAAIAGATRDGILQWYYLQHAAAEADPLELLWYDPTLVPVDPQGRLPQGRAFHGHGGCISSRTDWNPRTTACVVYGKASREENHEHNDDGQVCIDGYGERLIVDLGSPSRYPEGFFDEDRWKYYNASVHGHNVLTFGGREMRTLYRERGQAFDSAYRAIQGRIRTAEFDDARGGYWHLDLAPAYDGVTSVRRTVVHLHPGIVAVLDEAELEHREAILLRWHTIDRSEPDDAGRFTVQGRQAHVAGRVLRLDGAAVTFARGEHRYTPPYDRDRLGAPLEQRHESFVEAALEGNACRLLSLFAVFGPGMEPAAWEDGPEGWRIRTPGGTAEVAVTDTALRVSNPAVGVWDVTLGSSR